MFPCFQGTDSSGAWKQKKPSLCSTGVAKDNTDLYPARLGLQKVDGFLILSSSGYLFSQYIRKVKNQAAIIFPQFVSVLALPGRTSRVGSSNVNLRGSRTCWWLKNYWCNRFYNMALISTNKGWKCSKDCKGRSLRCLYFVRMAAG